MNKIIENLTQKVVSKPIKYLIVCSILSISFIAQSSLKVSRQNLILTSCGVLIGFIVMDIIQHFHKKGK